ncbi:MAG: HNH endonuclease [Promethearchaeia archaeon]
MSRKITKKCQSLEKDLSTFKLWADLVPKTSFFKNLRKVLSSQEWDIIRKAVYKKFDYKCSICGKKDTKLEAHENWKYNYEHSIQNLDSIDSLCYMCHRNKHLGHSGILIKKGELNPEKLIAHWAHVNRESPEKFPIYAEKVFELWDLKNEFRWDIVDNKGNRINENIDINNILELIAKDYKRD